MATDSAISKAESFDELSAELWQQLEPGAARKTRHTHGTRRWATFQADGPRQDGTAYAKGSGDGIEPTNAEDGEEENTTRDDVISMRT